MTCPSIVERRTVSSVRQRQQSSALLLDSPSKLNINGSRRVCPRQLRIAGRKGAFIKKRFVQNNDDSAALDAGESVTKEINNRICHFDRREDLDLFAGQTRTKRKSVPRLANSTRLQRIMQLPLDYISHPQFLDADAESSIMANPPGLVLQAKPAKLPSGLAPYLASLYEVPLLTREQEAHLFRKFNFLKYKASKLRSQLNSGPANHRLLETIERLYEAAVDVKNQILRANLRLVVSIAKRYVRPGCDLWELISDGNMSLIKAVEKFDFALGNRISTYASWAIMRNFGRAIPTQQRHQDRFRTSHFETLAASQEHRSDPQEQETAQRQRAAQVRKILTRLDEREYAIVIRRFGLLPGHEPRTLEEIGAEMGVSKERVRQIQMRALNKLRIAASEEQIEILGLGGDRDY